MTKRVFLTGYGKNFMKIRIITGEIYDEISYYFLTIWRSPVKIHSLFLGLALTILQLSSFAYAQTESSLSCTVLGSIDEKLVLQTNTTESDLVISSAIAECDANLPATMFTATAANLDASQLKSYAKSANVSVADIDHLSAYGSVNMACEVHGSQGLALLYNKNNQQIGLIAIIDQRAYPCE
jgi:hypothetical protein